MCVAQESANSLEARCRFSLKYLAVPREDNPRPPSPPISGGCRSDQVNNLPCGYLEDEWLSLYSNTGLVFDSPSNPVPNGILCFEHSVVDSVERRGGGLPGTALSSFITSRDILAIFDAESWDTDWSSSPSYPISSYITARLENRCPAQGPLGYAHDIPIAVPISSDGGDISTSSALTPSSGSSTSALSGQQSGDHGRLVLVVSQEFSDSVRY